MGITVSQGKRMEREGKDYVCPTCVEKRKLDKQQKAAGRFDSAPSVHILSLTHFLSLSLSLFLFLSFSLPRSPSPSPSPSPSTSTSPSPSPYPSTSPSPSPSPSPSTSPSPFLSSRLARQAKREEFRELKIKELRKKFDASKQALHKVKATLCSSVYPTTFSILQYSL